MIRPNWEGIFDALAADAAAAEAGEAVAGVALPTADTGPIPDHLVARAHDVKERLDAAIATTEGRLVAVRRELATTGRVGDAVSEPATPSFIDAGSVATAACFATERTDRRSSRPARRR